MCDKRLSEPIECQLDVNMFFSFQINLRLSVLRLIVYASIYETHTLKSEWP